jgi:hypothetical protein
MTESTENEKPIIRRGSLGPKSKQDKLGMVSVSMQNGKECLSHASGPGKAVPKEVVKKQVKKQCFCVEIQTPASKGMCLLHSVFGWL